MTARGVARSIKNYAKGFSDAQIRVREATSNDPWGPSGTIMNEIAQMTYNEHDFVEIMDMIDRRLNDKGKNWRHVFKALLLLDYCIHVGSENVVLYAKENAYVVKTLKEFQHIDDNGRDVGANVRQKAKDISSLLMDDARLREERQSRGQMRDRMAGVGDYFNETMGYGRGGPPGGGPSTAGSYYGSPYSRTPGPRMNNNNDADDRELQRAIEESRRLAQNEKKNQEQSDSDLARAIEMSEQEARELERKKREKLARQNEKDLLGDDDLNPFPQNYNAQINPYAAQQQQPTGMSSFTFNDPISANNNPWAAAGMQAQMTGLPQQYTGAAPFQPNTMMSPQSMMLQQQQQQQQQPMVTGMSMQQPNNFGGSQFQNTMPTGLTAQQPMTTGMASPFQSNTPSAMNWSPATQSSMAAGTIGTGTTTPPQVAMATGTNNPFGPSQSPLNAQPTGQQLSSSMPTGGNVDPRYAKLNSLLASGEGQDTFGNTGNLRVPVGTGFANSMKTQPNGTAKSSSTSDLVGLDVNNTGQPTRNPFAPQATGSFT
ncbi:hypothetical protein O0I10_001876 [Lichtheimia ornata]|uniref:ENTH domain-containing protein n=1 Tax=Lichtheimia ornata TaxID=688661 RepID=A0AAD7Y286_9FUNG|nr:uncharacterized protein O0I10_001876 [Lichtheimia ornata]KAJ8662183.1 hypothetical protein O0I10_001876 [Lichtheimia ornata]